MSTSNIVTKTSLARLLRHWRGLGGTIVFTNGCFDVLHTGHLAVLQQCREAGDYVVVGLNSDQSVARLKGPQRPYHQENDRAKLLAALRDVDAVIIFEEDTPLDLIQMIKPDVLVKGGDYQEEEIAGAAFVRQHGGQVVLVPLVEGKSTTAILNATK
ncbi:MAG: D-glycero-beta-D-manno-heptose 1-phosphate adenylyltransferase [Chitinophagales bacterium]